MSLSDNFIMGPDRNNVMSEFTKAVTSCLSLLCARVFDIKSVLTIFITFLWPVV